MFLSSRHCGAHAPRAPPGYAGFLAIFWHTPTSG